MHKFYYPRINTSFRKANGIQTYHFETVLRICRDNIWYDLIIVKDFQILLLEKFGTTDPAFIKEKVWKCIESIHIEAYDLGLHWEPNREEDLAILQISEAERRHRVKHGEPHLEVWKKWDQYIV